MISIERRNTEASFMKIRVDLPVGEAVHPQASVGVHFRPVQILNCDTFGESRLTVVYASDTRPIIPL